MKHASKSCKFISFVTFLKLLSFYGVSKDSHFVSNFHAEEHLLGGTSTSVLREDLFSGDKILV